MKVTLTKIGGSRAVILPSLWFKQHEEEPNTMTEVEMEIGETITISPVKPNKEGGTDGSSEQTRPAEGSANPGTGSAS